MNNTVEINSDSLKKVTLTLERAYAKACEDA